MTKKIMLIIIVLCWGILLPNRLLSGNPIDEIYDTSTDLNSHIDINFFDAIRFSYKATGFSILDTSHLVTKLEIPTYKHDEFLNWVSGSKYIKICNKIKQIFLSHVDSLNNINGMNNSESINRKDSLQYYYAYVQRFQNGHLMESYRLNCLQEKEMLEYLLIELYKGDEKLMYKNIFDYLGIIGRTLRL